MRKIFLITCLVLKNVFVIKEVYYKNYFVKAASINDQITCHCGNRNDQILLREMHIMKSNVFRFQKEPLLTLKDPKNFGYLKLEISFARIKEEEK